MRTSSAGLRSGTWVAVTGPEWLLSEFGDQAGRSPAGYPIGIYYREGTDTLTGDRQPAQIHMVDVLGMSLRGYQGTVTLDPASVQFERLPAQDWPKR
jgi:hypothetical protein